MAEQLKHWCEEHTNKTAAGWWLRVHESLPVRCECCERQATWMLAKHDEEQERR